MSDHLTGEVIGFRQWYVTPDLRLRAAHMRSQEWEAGTNEAKCHKANVGATYIIGGAPVESEDEPKACESAPGSDCECGWYALHDPSDFWYGQGSGSGGLLYSSLLLGATETDPLVSGVVAAWGNMEVHHAGFRAQFARVVAIALPEGKRDAAVGRAVAAEYGVPVVDAKRLTQIAGEFGSTVPVEMRPEKPEPKDELTGGFSVTFNSPTFNSPTFYSHFLNGTNPYPAGIGSRQRGAFLASSLWTPQPSDASKSILGAFDFSLTDDPTPEPPKVSGPSLPRKRPKYDPRAFIPKRNGGLR